MQKFPGPWIPRGNSPLIKQPLVISSRNMDWCFKPCPKTRKTEAGPVGLILPKG